jgi:hypothetical protein
VVEHSLGKGEVESSIPSGSTISLRSLETPRNTLNGIADLEFILIEDVRAERRGASTEFSQDHA